MVCPHQFIKFVTLFAFLTVIAAPGCQPSNGLRNGVFCGNNHIQASEECDNGANNGNAFECTSECKIAVCGDGLVFEGIESCDNGEFNSNTAPNQCRTDCTPARCGDGVVDEGESCDDGNSDNLDRCANSCTLPTCGNGVKEWGEECDDGNIVETDDCLTTCLEATCGDGRVHSGVEGCDDGDTDNTNSCLNTCVQPSCGDGYTEAGVEQCDDGNTDNRDGCLNTCEEATCGDGYVNLGREECDDANQTNTDACKNNCIMSRCGDGIVEDGVEECDDGNRSNVDGCLNNCATAVCGDVWVWLGVEECDDGDDSNADGCLNNCNLATCGDGFIKEGEEYCDDGASNGMMVGACTTDCTGLRPPPSMVFVPAGEFLYGENEETRSTDAFYIDTYEVSAANYQGCHSVDACPGESTALLQHNASNRAVSGIQWQSAEAYCMWKGKRLPTEIEWEKAARGTDGRTYPWGESRPDSDYVLYGNEIGQIPEALSPYGAHDMGGNLWEWTSSRFSPGGSAHVFRGYEGKCWIRNYGWTRAGIQSHDRIGFRCAESP